MSESKYPVLEPDLQIEFYFRLQIINQQYLYYALSETVTKLDISKIDKQLSEFVNPEHLKKVASFGLRGEIFFPVPYIIESNPKLLGYYRLLLGISQKAFYNKGPFGLFKGLEERGIISPKAKPYIADLCFSLIGTSQIMVEALDDLSQSIVRDLQLLTIGPQLRGGVNTDIGAVAANTIYELIKDSVSPYTIKVMNKTITIKNDSKRIVKIIFSSDPDIRILEMLATGSRSLVSIEIKGGRDASNIHNRLGEAEKSHQKAKENGFFEFWTIIGVDLDPASAKTESPTTNRFFNFDRIQDPKTEEYRLFRDLLSSLLSIQIGNKAE
jgi:hypothetical protein